MSRIALFTITALSLPAAGFAQTTPAPAPTPAAAPTTATPTTATPTTAAPGTAAPATAAPASGAPKPIPGKPTLTAGTNVLGSDGVSVGTIDSNDGTNSVLNTGAVKVTLANASFGNSTTGPTLAMTKTQLDAAANAKVAESSEAMKLKLVAGAQVYGSSGNMVGTIKSADAQFVTLTTPKGDVRIPLNGFGSNEKGVMLNMTDAELAAAIKPAAK